ncbi:MAG: DAK2 domain-containing protein [Anaerolineae bacterium]|nr:DAK2 domain-containing protein [Anaerolineae bacterium]
MAEKTSTARLEPPFQAVGGQEFKWLTKAALTWLQHHQQAINALNVYPVPDGDTGINMVLTMQSAWDEIKDSSECNVGQVTHRMAHGAMYGARGNSGVILSQVWRGFARSLDEKDIYRAQDLAEAFQEAATTAYTAVVEPVEGTILTVARAVADAAAKAAGETDDLVQIWERLVFAAHEAVVLTPSLLPVLAEAGVVDAGGQGLYVILEGMLRHMHGEPIAEDMDLSEAVDLVTTGLVPSEVGYGYDVQFLIVGQELDVDTTRQEIKAMGECPLVVGDQAMIKVHVHVPDPGIPISYGASLGSLRDVIVEDMQAQYQDFIVEKEASAATRPESAQEIGVVAVVMGDGLARVFQSLGANAIVHGGQTMNPSTQDLLDAIESLPSKQVIVLPNNSNVVMAAEQARDLSNKPVAVIPTKFVPEGIAALLGLNPQADLETNVSSMTFAVDGVETGEVTFATRSATIDGLEVADGEIIGLHNGTLKVTGSKIEDVVRELLKVMDTTQSEIITLYWGETVSEDDAQTLAELVQQDWPEQEIEVVAGSQPHYHYILSME